MLRRTLLAGLAALSLALPAQALPAQALPGRAESDPEMWRAAEAMAASIEAPRIPDRGFDPARFGGRADGRSDARPAIQKAIDAAHRAGGGRVTLSPGVWFSRGPVRLKSHVELRVEAGATLLFSPEPDDYLPPVKTRWEGTEVYTYSPFIYAAGVEDVAITGGGVIDGNAQSRFHAWHNLAEPDFQRLRRMGFEGVPVAQRRFGKGTHLRPPLIQVFGGKRVRLEGFTARNSPFWVNHLVYADEVVVRGITVDSHFPNNDGVDVESSTRVLIENSRFRTGDDSVVIKSGRDLDGRRIGRPSAWVLVRGNDMGGEDGIALGSEMSGGVHDVFFTDNVLRKGLSAIRFKANLDRGGTVERVRVRNMTVEDFGTLFWFQLNYPGELGGNFPSTYRDIVFENFKVGGAGTFFEAHAPAQAPLKDVVLRNIVVREAKVPWVLENVERLTLESVVLGGQRFDGELKAQVVGSAR
ncbi:exo-poly-alpha-D-galacturonosidase [Phenylobacterium zucineum HLK1]|uniref:Exo-poly-alpha-D-galacturonosidase n=1 Tax=Phenylobacterium zucineum (strain HLK1) TaxID=450851 RepID=B4RGG5_PHEZH|nr:glycoside hydrolase family 28 protein [Phenylobacterium zucineum]ACG78871.1 exo-poly-alpha-D-galacturonosidase [Phenylobacterium zucineum HLK1]